MGTVLSNSFSEVRLGEDCLLHLSNLLADKFSGSKKFILVDSNTKENCLPVLVKYFPKNFSFSLIEIEAGEENKSLHSCEIIWSALSDGEIDKDSVLISLGGGVIGDLGGFSAATILRGVNHIQVPTSLLAMVDSSSGGKTGINFEGLKNQVGTFSQPLAIYIYPSFLETLPKRDLNSGMAEVAKHALIADAGLWNSYCEKKHFEENELLYFIRRSFEIKSAFVALDEKDLKERHALNFGHTVGHAIESFSLANHKEPILHGEAVAVGMIAEAYLSEMVLGLPATQLKEIVNCLSDRFKYIIPEFDPLELMNYMRQDKKNRNAIPDFTLIPSIGSVKINQKTSDENILIALQKTMKHFLNLIV